MSASPAEILRKYLVDQSVVVMGGTSGAWPAYYANKPETPDNVVVVYNTSPFIEGRVHNTGEVDEHAGIQVLIRGTDDRIAWNRGFDIQEKLRAIKRTTVVMPPETQTSGSVKYLLWCFRRTQSLMFIGEEEKNRRRLYTVNGFLTISLKELFAPVPLSAEITDIDRFTVTFNRPLDAGEVTQQVASWSVASSGGAIALDGKTAFSATTLEFSLISSSFNPGDVVTVSYNGSGNDLFDAEDDTPVAAFSGFSVSNPL